MYVKLTHSAGHYATVALHTPALKQPICPRPWQNPTEIQARRFVMLTHMSNDPRFTGTPSSEVTSSLEVVREQVDRILASDTLRASEVLRRLLRFLADKTFSGDADHLKEYSVGLDALGKPPTYDPRQDSGVRLQASRLRQKLDEYYRSEGRNDPLVIELPKGRFKLAWRPNAGEPVVAVSPLPAVAPLPAQPVPGVESSERESGNLKKWRSLAIGFAVLSLILALASVRSIFPRSQTLAENPSITQSTTELDALWTPFLSATHHLIIAFANPLFVRFQRSQSPDIVYHKIGNNSWNEALASPEFSALSRSLGSPPAQPSFNMVERSQLVSAFVLGQFFARRRGDISLARSGELSWQQLADNDVIQFAPLNLDEGQSALPVRPVLIVDDAGIRNLRPQAGEPLLYVDPPDHQSSDGEGLELVSMLPGPLGRTTVVTFASNHKWGVIGGVQSLTDPAFARVLVKKLKEPSGKVPAYYQIVFRIRYRDGTPTNTSYVTHRVLAITQNSSEVRTTK